MGSFPETLSISIIFKESPTSVGANSGLNQSVTINSSGYPSLKIYPIDELKPKYTSADAGQARFLGWKTDGLKRFKDLQTMNKAARATPESAALEAAILAKVRAFHGITAQKPGDSAKAKRRKVPDDQAERDALNLVDAEE